MPKGHKIEKNTNLLKTLSPVGKNVQTWIFSPEPSLGPREPGRPGSGAAVRGAPTARVRRGRGAPDAAPVLSSEGRAGGARGYRASTSWGLRDGE